MTPAPPPPPQPRPGGFLAELRDAVTARTFALVLGVLVIQLGFVFSYVGAFHHPTPHRAPIDVVARGQLSTRASSALNALPGAPLQATPVTSSAKALTRLHQDATDGVLLVDPRSGTDTLYVAGGGGAALATALQDVLTRVEAARHRQLRVLDAVPAQAGDARGLSGFYLVVGWLVGGYFAAAMLAIAHGARPPTLRRASIRLLSIALYAVVSGLGGALIVGPLLGALNGHLLALWGLGALIVFAAAAITMAFQVVAGVLGIGLAVVLFVVLGNPSAGGAYQTPLLPGFWRAISAWIPNGAGVHLVRKIVYFGGHDLLGELLVIAAYAAAGILVTLVGSAVKGGAKADAGVGPALASAPAEAG